MDSTMRLQVDEQDCIDILDGVVVLRKRAAGVGDIFGLAPALLLTPVLLLGALLGTVISILSLAAHPVGGLLLFLMFGCFCTPIAVWGVVTVYEMAFATSLFINIDADSCLVRKYIGYVPILYRHMTLPVHVCVQIYPVSHGDWAYRVLLVDPKRRTVRLGLISAYSSRQKAAKSGQYLGTKLAESMSVEMQIERFNRRGKPIRNS